MTQKQSEREQAIARLRETLKPGDTVWTQLKHRSRSGMMRVIQLVIIRENRPQWLGFNAAIALDRPYDREREGIKIGGCGMDMGFELVYELGSVLFREGFKVEGHGRNGDTSGWDKCGGYALKQEWL